MPTVFYGKKDEPGFELKQSKDLIAVRTRSGRSVTRAVAGVRSPVSAELNDGVLVAEYPESGVEVYRIPVGRGARSLKDRKTALRQSSDVRFAGGVLIDPATDEPVLYTENLFVKFVDSADPEDCVTALREHGLTVKNEVTFATNAYFAEAQEGSGQTVFDLATRLLERTDVEYCHPELIRPRAKKGIFPQQWHLKRTTIDGNPVDAHANVEAAHAIAKGEGVTIAIIDDGVDIDHPEFAGAGKIVAPRDATLRTGNPRPKDPDLRYPDDHGTACAGVACANGDNGASGVAPKARLMPIRLVSGLGSMREAEAFEWATTNGADVISCSWGPPDGDWWDPSDRSADVRFPLPAHTRLAIENAVTRGRGGKGCVVLFAAGNGNESMDSDQYASNPRVIAVAACGDRGKRSVYSDFGSAVWCAFPSSDFEHQTLNPTRPLTKGIWTVDRIGAKGYNPGSAAEGDPAGRYTNSFGGTSSACPGAAGVVALVLSRNPALKSQEVKTLLKQACDRIDPINGGYGANGHSIKYGYGRLNALTAVRLAAPQPQNAVTVSRTFDAPILDLQTVQFTLAVSDSAAVEKLTVGLDIQHTYISDLLITLQPPAGTGVGAIVLHNRAGGSTKNLKKAYDSSSTPALSGFAGKNCAGNWTLKIQDTVAQDAGTLVSFSIGLTFTHPSRVVRDAATPVSKKGGRTE